MLKYAIITVVWLVMVLGPSPAESWYYYGGPGYYHGYYSPGFKQYPSYYYNDLTLTSGNKANHQMNKREAGGNDATYYVSLLHPYRDITHYGYPHYYSYGHPIHLSYAGGNRAKRQEAEAIYRGRGYRPTVSKSEGKAVGHYYGPHGYYGAPWWSGYGRWGYYAKPGQQGASSYSYSL